MLKDCIYTPYNYSADSIHSLLTLVMYFFGCDLKKAFMYNPILQHQLWTHGLEWLETSNWSVWNDMWKYELNCSFGKIHFRWNHQLQSLLVIVIESFLDKGKGRSGTVAAAGESLHCSGCILWLLSNFNMWQSYGWRGTSWHPLSLRSKCK